MDVHGENVCVFAVFHVTRTEYFCFPIMFTEFRRISNGHTF